jgi:hypothetical protein
MTQTVQLLAIAGTVATETKARMAQLQAVAGQPGQFEGHARDHEPVLAVADGGVKLPSEGKRVRATVEEVLWLAQKALTRHWDLALTLDHANAAAKGDVTFGSVTLKDMPVGHMLWLSREVEALIKLVAALPELDPAKNWSAEGAEPGQVRSEPARTPRPEKVPGKFVLYEATEHHPAQVQRLDEDKVTGWWTQVNFSGAIDPKRKQVMLDRLREAWEALKMAREKANTATVTDYKEAEQVFGYVFG